MPGPEVSRQGRTLHCNDAQCYSPLWAVVLMLWLNNVEEGLLFCKFNLSSGQVCTKQMLSFKKSTGCQSKLRKGLTVD